jgi:hypothetical protein
MKHFMFVILKDVVSAFPVEFLKMTTYPDYLTAVVVAGVSDFVFVYNSSCIHQPPTTTTTDPVGYVEEAE